jgi:hypothetical protein
MQANVLLFSQRRIADVVAFCLAYEFEDVFAAVTEAHRIDATDLQTLEFSRRVFKLASLVSGSPRLARHLVPYPRNKVTLDSNFELFFPVFTTSYELYSLAMIPNWRQRCHKAACFITEIRAEALPEYLFELLSAFDHIFTGSRQSVNEVTRLTGRPCTYLPLAVDVLRFTPAPDQSHPIDVCNIGRRSAVTHQALLDDAERRKSFYYYDTVAASGSDLKHRTFRVDSAHEHRRMLATLLKHSRYFIANRSLVNMPELTAGGDEISARFYEGAAAGTVMLGEAPRSEEFKKQFDWPDAVIHVPFDCSNISAVLADLNSDPERLRMVRRNNARQAAQRHDWLNRINMVFDTLGLKPTEKMQIRAQRLAQLASQT